MRLITSLGLAGITLILASTTKAQQKLGDFGGTYNFLSKKWSGSFDFNQTAASQGSPSSGSSPYLDVFSGPDPFGRKRPALPSNPADTEIHSAIGIQSSASASFGDATVDSTNNMEASVYLDWDIEGFSSPKLNDFFKIHIGPTASSDQLGTKGILAGEFSAGYYWFPSALTCYLYLDLQDGYRWFDNRAPSSYGYFAPILMTTWAISKNLNFDVNVKEAKLSNQSVTVPDGWYFSSMSDLSWKPKGSFGLTAKWIYGYDVPSFKKANTITIGFTY